MSDIASKDDDPYYNYWVEGVASSLDEHGVDATPEQVDAIATDMQGGHDVYGEAFGHDVVNKNFQSEKDREIEGLKKSVADEKAKVHCRQCNGNGWIEEQAGPWTSNSQCWKCRGEGRHAP